MQKTGTLAVVLTVMLVAVAAQAQVAVPMNFPPPPGDWYDSGIFVNNGETITVVAFGRTARDNSASFVAVPANWDSPDGNPKGGFGTVITNKPSNCLIARIGTGGTPFVIGSYNTFVANASDNLYFSVNDSPRADNTGFLVAMVTGGNVVVAASSPSVSEFDLKPNYPNPFNPRTMIEYTNTRPANIRVSIYSVTGELVKTLIDSPAPAGSHRVSWDGTNGHGRPVASGTYFYSMWSDGKLVTSRKAILLK